MQHRLVGLVTDGAQGVARAGEIFICSSTREIVPVTRLDGRAVGDGEPGPVTQRLIAAFDALKRDFVEAA